MLLSFNDYQPELFNISVRRLKYLGASKLAKRARFHKGRENKGTIKDNKIVAEDSLSRMSSVREFAQLERNFTIFEKRENAG